MHEKERKKIEKFGFLWSKIHSLLLFHKKKIRVLKYSVSSIS